MHYWITLEARLGVRLSTIAVVLSHGQVISRQFVNGCKWSFNIAVIFVSVVYVVYSMFRLPLDVTIGAAGRTSLRRVTSRLHLQRHATSIAAATAPRTRSRRFQR